MNNDIGKNEDVVLIDKIILNGIVAYCDTHDENCETIGIKQIRDAVTFSGEIITTEEGFPFTKAMADRLGWGKCYASVRLVTGKTPIDPMKVEETIIESLYGDVSSKYSHSYSDFTGYLWTNEEFKVGGHSLPNILHSHKGEYIHMEIELYIYKEQ